MKWLDDLRKKKEEKLKYKQASRLLEEKEKRRNAKIEEIRQSYYTHPPKLPEQIHGIYKAFWERGNQWIDVGFNPDGYVFMGNPLPQESPKSIDDFTVFFGPVYIFDRDLK